jgi:hypothetical protein
MQISEAGYPPCQCRYFESEQAVMVSFVRITGNNEYAQVG